MGYLGGLGAATYREGGDFLSWLDVGEVPVPVSETTAPVWPLADDFLTSLDTRDGSALRRGFGAFPTGVAALAAMVAGEPTGMAVSSFTSVSLDPPLVSVCAARASRTWQRLRGAGRLGISVLSSAHEQAGRQLGAREADRFAGLSWRATCEGAVLLGEASAWFECAIEREIRAGDHEIIVLRVHRFGVDPQLPPLVFHASRYRRLAD